jgi:predicted O-methyltransferase YrrM
MIIRMRNGQTDLEGLEELCRELIRNTDRVVEIGCYAGESSQVIARYAAKLYCIDRWKDGLIEKGSGFNYKDMSRVEILFDAALIENHNVIKIRGDSSDLAEVFGENLIDLVYIDSLHDYETVRNDICRWWPKIKQGGHIGGHNHSARWPGVMRAVREQFGGPDKLYRDSSWIVQKRQNIERPSRCKDSD